MNKQESGYRWVVFASVLLAYYFVISQRTAPGLITDQLMVDFQVTAATIGLMSSFQFLAYAGFQIPIGLLSDRFGPSQFLLIGTLLTGIGCLIYSFSPNEYVLILSRFLVGIGDAMIFVNLVSILSQWFKPNEFGRLMGGVSLAGSLGSLTATVPFSLLISFTGWRTSFLSFGMILVIFSVFLYLSLIKKPKQIFKEEIKTKKLPSKNRESVWRILRRTFTSRQAWATFFCHFGVVGTYVGFIGSWGVPYGIQVFDLSRSEASQLMMYGLIGAIVGGFFISWMTGPHLSIKKIYTIVHMIVFCSWVGLFFTGVNPSFMIAVVLLVLIGFGNGAAVLTFVVVRQSFPMKEVGVVTGFANMGGFLSAVLLPIVFGKVLDLFSQEMIHFGYHYGFIIPALFSFLGLMGAMMLKEASKQEEAIPSVQ